MTDGFCHVELIYPTWLAWLVLLVGAGVCLPGFVRLATSVSSGKFTFPGLLEFSNIFPILLFLIGITIFACGVGGIAALDHPSFARWATGALPFLLSEADSPVSADLNDQPLGAIDIDASSAYYVIRLSPKARQVKVSGIYRDAHCDAELMNRICRNNSDKLTCVDDPAQRILRICAKDDDEACKNRTL